MTPVTAAPLQQSQSTPTAPEQESQEAQSLKQPTTPQEIVDESLRMMMPLEKQHIRQYRERVDERERALAPVPPVLRTRTVRVRLEPGAVPSVVYTTANVPTSLVFHDSTGQNWPISSVTNGGAGFFHILRPDVPEANIINAIPVRDYGSAALVVTLQGKDVPLVISLLSDSIKGPDRKADGMVLFQIGHQGPNAAVPVIANIKETVSSELLAFLDHTPPNEAKRVRIEPASHDVSLWEFEGAYYLRTADTLVSPGWTAIVNGAGNVKCYEMPVTSRFIVSRNGHMINVRVKTKEE